MKIILLYNRTSRQGTTLERIAQVIVDVELFGTDLIVLRENEKSRMEFKPRVTIAFPLQSREWYVERRLTASSFIKVPTDSDWSITNIPSFSFWAVGVAVEVAAVEVLPSPSKLSLSTATRFWASFSKDIWTNFRTFSWVLSLDSLISSSILSLLDDMILEIKQTNKQKNLPTTHKSRWLALLSILKCLQRERDPLSREPKESTALHIDHALFPLYILQWRIYVT